MGPHADTYIAMAVNRSYISDFYLGGSRFQSRPTHQLPYFVLTWFILILGTRWKRVVNLTSRPLYHRGRASCSHSVRGWVGTQSGPDVWRRYVSWLGNPTLLDCK